MKAVSVDFETRTARVVYEKGRPVEALLDAVRKAGYPDAKPVAQAPSAFVVKVGGMQRSESGKT